LNPTARNIIQKLIDSKVLPKRIKTKQALDLLAETPITRDKIYNDPIIRQRLGVQRYGKGRNLDFDTIKVLDTALKN